jgi:hypothetical protein
MSLQTLLAEAVTLWVLEHNGYARVGYRITDCNYGDLTLFGPVVNLFSEQF